jgi:hypothetical protein
MPAMEATESVETLWTVGQARERIAEHFASAKAKVSEDEEGNVVATRGSRVLIRILGAYLMPRNWIPTKATVGFTGTERGCRVDITVADNFGFGIRTGVKGRFGGLVDEQLAGIKAALG